MDEKESLKIKELKKYRIAGDVLITLGCVFLTVNLVHIHFFYVLFGSFTPFWVAILIVLFIGIIVLTLGIIFKSKAVDSEIDLETYRFGELR